MAKTKKRHGCLIFLLIIILFLSGAGFYIWKTILHPAPNPEAQKIINGPIDTAASRIVTKELTETAGSGISAVVVPMPSGNGNGLVIVLDTEQGFTPASGVDGKRKQVMETIRKIIQSNTDDQLQLNSVDLTYKEGGKNILSVASPIENLEELSAGTMTEKEFAEKIGLKINDFSYIKNLIEH